MSTLCTKVFDKMNSSIYTVHSEQTLFLKANKDIGQGLSQRASRSDTVPLLVHSMYISMIVFFAVLDNVALILSESK